MWVLGSGRYYVEVPAHHEVEFGARDVQVANGDDERDGVHPDEFWHLAEEMAYQKVVGCLFYHLSRARSVAALLAVKLVCFSARAHGVWLENGGKHNPRDSHRASSGDFLAGMLLELTRGPGKGPDWLWDPLRWPSGDGDQIADTIAYAIHEAGNCVHGRHNKDKDLACWLLKVRQRAHSVVGATPRLNHDHFMQAIGIELFHDPKETTRVFWA